VKAVEVFAAGNGSWRRPPIQRWADTKDEQRSRARGIRARCDPGPRDRVRLRTWPTRFGHAANMADEILSRCERGPRDLVTLRSWPTRSRPAAIVAHDIVNRYHEEHRPNDGRRRRRTINPTWRSTRPAPGLSRAPAGKRRRWVEEKTRTKENRTAVRAIESGMVSAGRGEPSGPPGVDVAAATIQDGTRPPTWRTERRRHERSGQSKNENKKTKNHYPTRRSTRLARVASCAPAGKRSR
jgi:hypothetical protein